MSNKKKFGQFKKKEQKKKKKKEENSKDPQRSYIEKIRVRKERVCNLNRKSIFLKFF